MEQRDALFFMIGAIISFILTCYFWGLLWITDFRISPTQTQQQIISFPNGTVFKKITDIKESEQE
jgi:hypothetical protein